MKKSSIDDVAEDLRSDAERAVCQAVREGSSTFVEVGPGDRSTAASLGPDQTIRGSVIRRLLQVVDVDSRILRVRGARISEQLSLEWLELARVLHLDGCHFDQQINFEQCSIPGINLENCTIPNGIQASQLHTHHNFVLSRATVGKGVWMPAARIDGQLTMRGATIDGDGKTAVLAPGIQVRQGAFLEALRCVGELHISGSEIGRGITLKDASLLGHTDGYAMGAQRLRVVGDCSFTGRFIAKGLVDLSGSTVTGRLDCKGGRFRKGFGGRDRERALDLSRIEVHQSVYFEQGFQATGTVDLVDARIYGNLKCGGGSFSNEADTAIDATGIKVGRDVAFVKPSPPRNEDTATFTAKGRVVLANANIRGKLDVTGGKFLNSDAQCDAIRAKQMKVGSIVFGTDLCVEGGIDLSQVRVTGEIDDRVHVQATSTKIKDLVFESLAGDGHDRDLLDRRIKWLDAAEYTPQTYRQLASVYALDGDEKEAKQILMADRRARVRDACKGRHRLLRMSLWFFDFFFRYTVGYGYRPFWVLYWLGALWLLGSGVFILLQGEMVAAHPFYGETPRAPEEQAAVGPEQSVPAFQPFIYTADLLLPVVDLKQASIWIPRDAAEWISVSLTICGWLLLTALVVGLGSAFKREIT